MMTLDLLFAAFLGAIIGGFVMAALIALITLAGHDEEDDD